MRLKLLIKSDSRQGDLERVNASTQRHALKPFLALAACLFIGLLMQPRMVAQWQTQDVTLKPGWNAVYLFVDASHETLLAQPPPAPVDEIWLWNPVISPGRFIDSPAQPVTGNDWSSWDRNAANANNTLAKLIGNAAYLVRNSSGQDYVWSVKGKPTPPSYKWTSRGVNLIGFSTPVSNPKTFSNFLVPAPRLASQGEFYRYDDGDGDLTPTLFNAQLNTVPVTRGQAYWIRQANEFNRYFGAFDLNLQSASGLHFGTSLSQLSLRIRNATASEITVSLAMLDSEAAPQGQTAIAGKPTILVRGALNTSNLTYASTSLANGPHSVTLKPRGEAGSETEIILGVNRATLGGNPGDLFAGILRLTDSAGYSQVDLPVSAEPSVTTGLWVGDVAVNQVKHYLNTYQRDAAGKPVTDAQGKYVVTGTDTSLGAVARPFNLRLIIHKNSSEARLLQRVFHGFNSADQLVIATQQSLLDSNQLASARRISASHLPFTDGNVGWVFGGSFAPGQSANTVVSLSFDDYSSNPFLHGFHPDHDNLNATFDAAQVRGAESYDINRLITLSFSQASNDFDSQVSAGNEMLGNYAEQIEFKGTGSELFRVETAGAFVLRRISEIATLTTAP